MSWCNGEMYHYLQTADILNKSDTVTAVHCLRCTGFPLCPAEKSWPPDCHCIIRTSTPNDANTSFMSETDSWLSCFCCILIGAAAADFIYLIKSFIICLKIIIIIIFQESSNVKIYIQFSTYHNIKHIKAANHQIWKGGAGKCEGFFWISLLLKLPSIDQPTNQFEW